MPVSAFPQGRTCRRPRRHDTAQGTDADTLVGELLDESQTLSTEQRRGIEQGLASGETSTEDMRLALRRYRSYFDRLLSI